MTAAHTEPLFKSVFGKDWDRLPPVMKAHYANHPRSDEVSIAEGDMKIELSPIGKCMAPVFALTGTLVPYAGDRIPTTVRFVSDPQKDGLFFDRVFNFPQRKPYRFLSRMAPQGGDQVIEYMRSGLGWHMVYGWTGEKVTLTHKRYVFRLCGVDVPLPVEFILGKGYAEETPIDDRHFSMMMEIRHPLWGRIYGYSGTFRMSDPS